MVALVVHIHLQHYDSIPFTGSKVQLIAPASAAFGLLVPFTLASVLVERQAPAPLSDFTRNEFFKPAADSNLWGTLYARSLQLPDKSLLMTWENYPKEPPLVNHPIFRSTNGGATWTNYSAVYDQRNGRGMRFQPFLYTLPQQFGEFPAGTIIAAGVSTAESLTGGSWIDVYASRDNAKTFNFISHIAYGDGPNTVNEGDKALWEPFFVTFEGKLICYYSDPRNTSLHSQQLVHQTTTDLENWSPIVVDDQDPRQPGRPGMTIIAHIESTNKWIMTYELCGTDGCNVWYKVSNFPVTFGSIPGRTLVATDGSRPASGPYVIWTRDESKSDGSGIIIVSAASNEEVFVNSDAATNGQWRKVSINHWSAYSRSLRIIDVQGRKRLFVGNGGNFGPKEKNGVACAVVPVPTL